MGVKRASSIIHAEGVLGFPGLKALLAFTPPELPRFAELTAHGGLDPTVLVFTLLLSVASGVLFGLTPALRVSRADLVSGFKDTGRGPGRRHLRIQAVIVVSELAVGLVLLLGAGLLIRSAVLLDHVEPGFHSDTVLTFKTSLSGAQYSTAARVTQYIRTLTDRIESLPGVHGAAYVSALCVPRPGGR